MIHPQPKEADASCLQGCPPINDRMLHGGFGEI
jgi:hypothetical protein